MESHKRILAFIYIISGILQIMVMLIVMSVFSTLLPFIQDEAGRDAEWVFRWLIPFIRMMVMFIIILFSIPSIIGGIALLNEKKWALSLLLILGCFKLFSFPIGTAIGIYTIWVYAKDQEIKKAVS
jgi:hypothetical protein